MKRIVTLVIPLVVTAVMAGCGHSSASTDVDSADKTGTKSGTVAGDRSLANETETIPTAKGSPRVRRFVFNYAFKLQSLAVGANVRVWTPVARNDKWQSVSVGEMQVPVKPKSGTESKYGNEMYYFETTVPASGELSFRIPYKIQRREIQLSQIETASSGKVDAVFLAANQRVPLDGKPIQLLANTELPSGSLQKARRLYDLVDDHVRYSKDGKGWGNGDSEWVCDSRFGNCTDFHSLFISLARSQKLPSKFEIGFPIPTAAESGKVGGYHCWGWFHAEPQGWIPVDISEADKHPEMKEFYFGGLTADRVAFSVGRDLVLTPRQTGPPLNFFVYPYAEVDDNILERGNLKLEFSYESVATSATLP